MERAAKHKVSWAYYGRYTAKEEALITQLVELVDKKQLHLEHLATQYNNLVSVDRKRTSGALRTRIEKLNEEGKIHFSGNIRDVVLFLDRQGRDEVEVDRPGAVPVEVVAPQKTDNQPNSKVQAIKFLISGTENGELDNELALELIKNLTLQK